MREQRHKRTFEPLHHNAAFRKWVVWSCGGSLESLLPAMASMAAGPAARWRPAALCAVAFLLIGAACAAPAATRCSARLASLRALRSSAAESASEREAVDAAYSAVVFNVSFSEPVRVAPLLHFCDGQTFLFVFWRCASSPCSLGPCVLDLAPRVHFPGALLALAACAWAAQLWLVHLDARSGRRIREPLDALASSQHLFDLVELVCAADRGGPLREDDAGSSALACRELTEEADPQVYCCSVLDGLCTWVILARREYYACEQQKCGAVAHACVVRSRATSAAPHNVPPAGQARTVRAKGRGGALVMLFPALVPHSR